MSRIGKKPILIPDKVKLSLAGRPDHGSGREGEINPLPSSIR